MEGFETDKKEGKRKFLPGMRVLKTVGAAFTCMVIDYFRNEIPLQTVITACICIQPSTEQSVVLALSRLVGTVVGALFGVGVTVIVYLLPFSIHPLVYYFCLSIIMIPLISILNKMQSSRGVIVSIVLFLSITIVSFGEVTTWSYILNRVLNTIIGIVVALVFNVFFPHKDRNREDPLVDWDQVDVLNIKNTLNKIHEKNNHSK